MEEKKYIDRLYQEKFKDFEAAPRKDLWKDISAKMKKEEKRKPLILPFWSRIAGAAAILTFILLLGDWLTQPLQPTIVNNEDEYLSDDLPEQIGIASVDTPEDPEPEIKDEISASSKNLQPPTQQRDFPLKISSISPAGIKETSTGREKVLNQISSKTTNQSKPAEKKSLLKEMRESSLEDQIASQVTDSKIEVSTHAAPIYYGNLKKGNFLDSRFKNNSSEGEITYSYGVNISYDLSERLKIRSGVSVVSMSHNTNDIALYAVINPSTVQSINYRPGLATASRKGPSAVMGSAVKTNINDLAYGMLNQKLGFIEVPVELEYAIISNRFALNIIGGASTLFLDENSISVSSSSFETVLGEANNLNEVSFSTNIGLGFDYHVSEKFKLNLEPMFKYQINTFNDKTGTYQPYYIGVYSGFSFKF